MKLKPAILATLSRDDLKQIVDELNINGVNRRSADDMRATLSRSRKVTAEDLLGFLRKDEIQSVCGALGLPTSGNRDELVDRLLSNGTVSSGKKAGRKMSQDARQTLAVNGNGQPTTANQRRHAKRRVALAASANPRSTAFCGRLAIRFGGRSILRSTRTTSS